MKKYAVLLIVTDRPEGSEPQLTTTEIARIMANVSTPAGLTIKMAAVEEVACE